ncbi:MAG: hypothetical protein K0S80_5040 [Neobacillus sp.]|nr:hypothetical protein [Neobacillus sp.]
MYWLIGTMLFQNYSALFVMNFKYFYIPDIIQLKLSHLLNRLVLIPVITLIFMNGYLSLHRRIHKVILFLIFMLLFDGIEWLAHRSGVLIHQNWNVWWSIGFWFLYGCLNILFMKWFRRRLSKEVPAT